MTARRVYGGCRNGASVVVKKILKKGSGVTVSALRCAILYLRLSGSWTSETAASIRDKRLRRASEYKRTADFMALIFYHLDI